MTKTIVKTYTVASEYRKQISYIILCACLVLVAYYAYSIYSVISRTVDLQKVQTEIAIVNKNIEGLDSKYLELSSQITPDGLGTFGFHEGKVSAYISRTVSLGRVALGGNEL